MTEAGTISREDTLLQIRLITEGVRYEVKGEAQWNEQMDVWTAVPVIIPDWTGRPAMTWPNPYSSLKLVIDGDKVTLSEMGEVVGTAKLEQKPAWYQEKLRDGTTVESVYIGTHTIESNISIFNRCYAVDCGKRCKFCGLFPGGSDEWGKARSLEETLEAVKRPVEATCIAVKNGWRGGIVFPGGAAAPDKRDQFTTDILEAIMTQFREELTEQEMSELTFRPSVYPPKDLKQMEKWKDLGMTRAEFDSQVLDPAYFTAICPGRGEQREWFEAQEAAVEVFGDFGCVSALVAGIEPMAGMLEGIEERVSKGVMLAPLIFRAFPNAEMRDMRPPSPEWYLELLEKFNAIYVRHSGMPMASFF